MEPAVANGSVHTEYKQHQKSGLGLSWQHLIVPGPKPEVRSDDPGANQGGANPGDACSVGVHIPRRVPLQVPGALSRSLGAASTAESRTQHSPHGEEHCRPPKLEKDSEAGSVAV